jgi:ATP-binding cassette subfamily B multidrug efflux pump
VWTGSCKPSPDYDTVLRTRVGICVRDEEQLLSNACAPCMPSVLILDGASSVDTRTGVLVQEAMSAWRASRTSFVSACQ